MKILKASFRCPNFDKAELLNKRCLLTISVGQQSHEAEYFEATIQALNATFSDCMIVLGDTLQRYTLALKTQSSAQSMNNLAYRKGSDWLARNEKYLTQLSIPYNIIRWDEWLKHCNYPQYKQKILHEIETDNNYRDILDQTAINYVVKHKMRLSPDQAFDEKLSFALCRDYLIEECTVLCLWPITNYEYEAYPAAHNAIMQETRRRFVHVKYPLLTRSIKISFNYRKNFFPQQLSLSTA